MASYRFISTRIVLYCVVFFDNVLFRFVELWDECVGMSWLGLPRQEHLLQFILVTSSLVTYTVLYCTVLYCTSVYCILIYFAILIGALL